MASSEETSPGMIENRPNAYLKLYHQTVVGQNAILYMHLSLRWLAAHFQQPYFNGSLLPLFVKSCYNISITQTLAIGGPITAMIMA